MKGINIKIIKELIISILIVLCIILLISLIFYDKISIGKIIPESEEYQLSKEMTQEIEEGILEQEKESIIEYSIDAADLKKSEKSKEYNKGKVNPFAIENTIIITNTIVEGSQTTNENNSSKDNYFYEDEGIK